MLCFKYTVRFFLSVSVLVCLIFELLNSRAIAFPKVTRLFCRLPLLTFFYVARGFSPKEPDAVIGTIILLSFSFSSPFHGPLGSSLFPLICLSGFFQILFFFSSWWISKEKFCPIFIGNLLRRKDISSVISHWSLRWWLALPFWLEDFSSSKRMV